MKIGILGFSQSGKKTLFHVLTGNGVRHPGVDATKPIPGTANIRDHRFGALVELYRPKSEAPAKIHVELFPDIDKRLLQEGKIFRDIAGMDALCHVVRGFEDPSVYHVSGSVEPLRDLDEINAELLFHDLGFVEKRLERLAHDELSGKQARIDRDRAILERLRSHLEAEQPLRTFPLSPEDRRAVATYPLITLKEMVVALNTSEDRGLDHAVDSALQDRARTQRLSLMVLSAKFEAEVAELESAEERQAFLDSAGVREPALARLTRQCMSALGLISFFTVGPDEVRQWLVRAGSTAPQAGRAIHSDIERGFIRAEVMKYDDLMAHGSEQAVKKAGKYQTMGRDYIVEDGDIINFLFNV